MAGSLKALLSRRDWVYLLSLLVPFVVYSLALKAYGIALQPGHQGGLAQVLGLMQADVFFNLGYALLWIGLFAVVQRRPLRLVVIFLFHATTMLVVVTTTVAHYYFLENGTTLDYGTIAEWIPKFKEIVPILFQGGVPLLAWMLLAAAFFYVALGPWFVAGTTERWRGWPKRRFSAIPAETSFLGSLGLLLLALGFGSLSLLTGTTTLARAPFVNVILTGIEQVTTEEEISDAGQLTEHPATHASLAETFRTQKRNVVLIHLESTRAQSVTPYNEDLKTTPYLDELAKESLLVEQAYVVVPRSSKATVTVNCGIDPPLYQGPEFDPGGIPVPCLASLLKDQGYSTVFFQSSSETMDQYGVVAENLGYEEYYPSESMDTEGFEATNYISYEDDIMLKPSEQWLKGHKEKPFLAQYLTGTGHDDYRCLDTRYGSENFSEDDLLNHYLNCLRLQDIFLENLFDQYKELGLYEETIFVIYGDHGEGFGEHGRFLHGDTPWEEGLRVPLIIHDPKQFKNGEQVEGLSNQTDILPTVVEMLGYEIENAEYPGYSLLRPLPGERTLRFSCISSRKCLASINGDEKYIYHYDNQPEEVFNLSEDPLEEHNLADEYSQEELDRRRKDLFQWLSRIDAEYGGGSLPWDSLSEESTRQQPKESGGQPASSTAAIGQPLTVGDVEWTVTSAYLANQLVSAIDYGTKQGNFVVVNFQFKNNSNEGLTLSSDSLALFDGNGRRFKFDTDTYLYIEWSKALFRFEVGPGDSQEGQIIFKVAPDASQFQLQLGEETPFSNNSGYVNLGF